jgi:hypothetical protein
MIRHLLLTLFLGAIAPLSYAVGLDFQCQSDNEKAQMQNDVSKYFDTLEIQQRWYRMQVTLDGVQVALQSGYASTSPVFHFHDPTFDLKEERFVLPTSQPGVSKTVLTASKKEIVLGLLHPGRTTVMPCNIAALQNHVGVRQSIAAWAENMEWTFPDGTPARWNDHYWDRGTPKTNTTDAVMDTFLYPKKYAIGCYTAAKLTVLQGILQYHAQPGRESTQHTIEHCLWQDKDPLVALEPGAMWFFETEATQESNAKEGKLLTMIHDVDPENFIPGDWSYFINTDEKTSKHAGYEGSNAIYLGRGKFNDYYKDRNHFYTYFEKLDEVYQWRNEVFSRSRHLHRIQPLTIAEVRALGRTPWEGGLVFPYRVVPKLFDVESSKICFE